MYFKNIFRIFRKQRSRSSGHANKSLRSSVNFPARADCKSTGCVKITLDGRSTPARACATSPRLSVQTPARADCKHNKSAGYTNFPLERQLPCLSGSPKSRIPRFELQAQNQVLMHQIRSSWANILENTSKLKI